MKKFYVFTLLFSLFLVFGLQAQLITYSKPEREDTHSLGFDIIGKMNGNYLIYKSYKDQSFISVYDGAMNLKVKSALNFMPTKQLLDVDFVAYSDYAYMVYQFVENKTVHCMAARIDGDGNLEGSPVEIDQMQVASNKVQGKVYSLLTSEDKTKLALYRIVSPKQVKSLSHLDSWVFDASFNLLGKSSVSVPLLGKQAFLAEPQIDNDGNLAWLQGEGDAQSGSISSLVLQIKPLNEASVSSIRLRAEGIYLDDIRLRIDNTNGHYLVTSFYTGKKRGDVEGLYLFLWDKNQGNVLTDRRFAFSREMKNRARGNNSLKAAFDHYYLKDIILKPDGGFVLSSEALISESRQDFDRWGYLYGTFPFWNGWGPYGFYSRFYWGWGGGLYGPGFYPPFFGGWRWGWDPFWGGPDWDGPYRAPRFSAMNIAVFSFSGDASLQWFDVINKAQRDINSDNFIGYGLVNTGNTLHYLFNVRQGKQGMLINHEIDAEGNSHPGATLRNYDDQYSFMPHLLKQVDEGEFLVPCERKGQISFAKVNL